MPRARSKKPSTSPPANPQLGHPLLDALRLIGRKWAMPVLFHLYRLGRPVRFSELQRTIGGVTPKELTKRLRELERVGLVSRTIHPEIPPRVEYALTAVGGPLVEPLNALSRWAESHAEALARDRPHR